MKNVPLERVLPLIRWLLGHYGGLRPAAQAVGVPYDTMRNLARGEHARCRSATALLIADGVMNARRIVADPYSWSELGTRPRPPTPRERRLAKKINHAVRVIDTEFTVRSGPPPDRPRTRAR